MSGGEILVVVVAVGLFLIIPSYLMYVYLSDRAHADWENAIRESEESTLTPDNYNAVNENAHGDPRWSSTDNIELGIAARKRQMNRIRASRSGFVIGQELAREQPPGTWTVVEVLRGGFGLAYVVRLKNSGRTQVLKTFDERFLRSDEDRERFEREASMWLELGRHPNVIPALGIERVEGLPCVITDYVPGGNLGTLISNEGSLDTETTLKYAFQICDGLEYAHGTLGLVHRDVKPANCLVAESFTVRVTSFGLAHAFSEEQIVRSRESLRSSLDDVDTSAARSFLYMAPEQFMDKRDPDTRADIYAFGAVLLEMVTGATPSRPLRAHDDAITRLSATADPHPLAPVVIACTSPRRDQRPSSFAEVRDMVEGVHRSELSYPVPARVRPVSTW